MFLKNKEIQKINIEGTEYELWIKGTADEQPEPYRKDVTGSGFFLSRDTSLFLVTAAHVAKKMDSHATATIRGAEDQPQTFDLNHLCGANETITWTYHSEGDVAVLPLSPKQQIRQQLTKHFLPFRLVLADEQAPSRERPVTIIGFPLQLGATGRFSPISQKSKPNSGLFRYSFPDHQERTIFTLGKPGVGGFSGAPVLELPGVYSKGMGITTSGSTRLVGLVSSTLKDQAGGKFCAVMPSFYIAETLAQVPDQ